MYQTEFKPYSFLENLDMFGKTIGIRFNQEPVHKTKFGGILTLVILGLTFFQLIVLLQGVFEQKTPTVIFQDRYVENPQRFDMSPQTFTIALGLEDKFFNHYINEKIYHIKAFQKIAERKLNPQSGQVEQMWTANEIKVTPCKERNFQIEGNKDYFLNLNYENLYCFDVSNQNLAIEGGFSSTMYQAIDIEVHKCTENCEKQEIFDDYMGKPTLGAYISNYTIQITDKNEPFKAIGKDLFWISGPQFEKYISLYFRNVYIDTDDSIFGENYSQKRIITYSSDREQVLPSSGSILFNLNLSFEKNKESTFDRKYSKILQAISQLGGMFNVMVAIGCAFSWPISQLELNRKLINAIFQISKADDLKQSEDLKQGDDLKQQQPSNSQIKNSNQSIKPTKKSQADLKKYFQATLGHIQVKFCDYLMHYFNVFEICRNYKYKFIKYGTNKLYQNIDIFQIITKMNEIDKLKNLLLNENQLKLFDYLPKPILVYSEKLDIDEAQKLFEEQNKYRAGISNDYNKTFEQKVEEAQQAFQQIMNKKRKDYNMIDKKLIEMLDQKLVEVFENKEFMSFSQNRNSFLQNQQSQIIQQADSNVRNQRAKSNFHQKVQEERVENNQNQISDSQILRKTFSSQQLQFQISSSNKLQVKLGENFIKMQKGEGDKEENFFSKN